MDDNDTPMIIVLGLVLFFVALYLGMSMPNKEPNEYFRVAFCCDGVYTDCHHVGYANNTCYYGKDSKQVSDQLGFSRKVNVK